MPSPVDPRRIVGVHAEYISNVSSTDFPGHYPDEDHSWDLAKFKKNLKVQVMRLSNRSIDFDLIGVDASIANAYRRILIAEVPTVCIENVYVWNNTSVVVDEVMAHRLGLVPLNIDPALVDMKQDINDPATDRNTFVFQLQVTCTRGETVGKDSDKDKKGKSKPRAREPTTTSSSDVNEIHNSQVLSSHLVWQPQGEQSAVFKPPAHPTPGPTNPNIVLAKLAPGQEIEIEMHAVKGVGKDHAKFSPVATASYRLLPTIELLSQPPPELAEKFQACFSPGVIKINPVSKMVSVDKRMLRTESVSREVFRHAELRDCVKLGRMRDHFLFNIESESAYAPERLLLEAIAVMRAKIKHIQTEAEALRDSGSGVGVDQDVNMDIV